MMGDTKQNCSLCRSSVFQCLFMQVTSMSQIGYANYMPFGDGMIEFENVFMFFGIFVHNNLVKHFEWTTDKTESNFNNWMHGLF